MELPYITDELPGIGGQLRSRPEHFIVEEIPLYEASGQGQHLYINITRVGLTTKEIERRLARLFSFSERDIGFAGMKDKYAQTTQTFSLPVGHQDEGFADSAIGRIEDHLSVRVNWATFHNNKLRLGHLLGNRFRIVITDLAMEPPDALVHAQAVGDRLLQSGMPNYFGPQRFGRDGANIERGLAVLLRQQYVKDRWLRRFLVSAYQSYLCNCYLAQRVELGLFGRLIPGDIAKKHATGGIFDVVDVAAEQLRFDEQEISFTAPLFGTKMKQAQGEAGKLEAKILAESPITIEQLRKAKVEGTRRLGRLLAPDLVITESLPLSASRVAATDEMVDDALPTDGAIEVAFSLPKGSFATSLLREIMKTDLAYVPDE